ncbi:MAG TPA: peptide-methionine (R)-S-oxide reductase, partial [Longimicrobium sp.]|nr:peptide-methionine (R)-S-oxide reductase [Longimicrobium sp.]
MRKRVAFAVISAVLIGGIVTPAMAQAARQASAPVYTRRSDAELRRALTPLQYQVTQHEVTEPPFHNEFWNNHRPGIYVDV